MISFPTREAKRGDLSVGNRHGERAGVDEQGRNRCVEIFASKKFIEGEPMNPATNTLTGLSYSTCGVSNCWRMPSRMTAMRVAMVMASIWSWVT